MIIICNLLSYHVRELLHTKKRQEETYDQLRSILGEACISCELQSADSKYEARRGMSSISPAVAEELFASEYSKKECHMQTLSPDMTRLKKAAVNVDNSLSPSHTVLQMHCVDHKGLLYDIMRTLKDYDVQVLITCCLFAYFLFLEAKVCPIYASTWHCDQCIFRNYCKGV